MNREKIEGKSGGRDESHFLTPVRGPSYKIQNTVTSFLYTAPSKAHRRIEDRSYGITSLVNVQPTKDAIK